MKKGVKLISALLVLIMLLAPANMLASAVSTADIQNKIVSVAKDEVGYTEYAKNKTKYGDWYGWQGAWCTTFAIWVYYKAGNSLGITLYGKACPNGGNCNSMISWYQNKGRYYTRSSGYTPQKGDFVFFDWNNSGSSDHVGIVTGTSGSTIYTVEGNCSGKVKSKSYTKNGSKPYGNISSIMGYGNPNLSGAPKQTTTKKKTTTKKATTKKATTKATTKKSTTKKSTTKKATTKASKSTTKKKVTTTKKKTTTTKVVLPKDMKLYAPTYDLQVGDSVKLDYTIEPANAQAVVGYFCDEEDVVKINNGGEIKAIGEGRATVVVCANDEIYRQVDFDVSPESVGVTQHSPNKVDIGEPTTQLAEKSFNQKAVEIGVNIDQLQSHKDDYKYPVYIISATAVLSALVVLIRKIVLNHKAKKKKDENMTKNE